MQLSLRFSLFTLLTALLAGWLLCAQPAVAQVTVTDGDLEAAFSNAPLFSAPTSSNLAPVAVQTGTITVTNNGSDTETVLLAALATSSTGLAEAVELTVTEGESVRYVGTFADFFATSSVVLSDLAAAATTSYTLTATFLSDSGNEYQGTGMAFDLRIGFASGVGVTSPAGGGGTGGGGNGGSSSGGIINRAPTPGDSNNPDGDVAGIATSNEFPQSDSLWPWWDTAVAAVGDALRPDRGNTSTTVNSDEAATSSTSSLYETIPAEGAVAGMSDNLTDEAFCILFWFVLLALLGVGSHYGSRYESLRAATMFATLRTRLLIFTVSYLVLLYVLSLLTVITTWVGWVLFVVWALYHLFDIVRHWQISREFSWIRFMLLGGGLVLLFYLPEWIMWICPWW